MGRSPIRAGLRGAIQVLQKVFKFRTCTLDIDENDPRWRWYRPCLLHSIAQCTAPCNFRISKEQYRNDIHRLQRFLEGGKNKLLGRDARGDGRRRPANCNSRRPPGCAMKSRCSKRSTTVAVWKRTFSRKCFRPIRSADWPGLKKVLHLQHRPRMIEGIDIAHLAGTDTVAAVVQFIDGLPFKPGYRRMRIQGVAGPDDTASIHEAVSRRFQHIRSEGETPPDILLDRRRPRPAQRGAGGLAAIGKGDWLRADFG